MLLVILGIRPLKKEAKAIELKGEEKGGSDHHEWRDQPLF
jgi:hypothetical protein